jgi:hypothetical protein
MHYRVRHIKNARPPGLEGVILVADNVLEKTNAKNRHPDNWRARCLVVLLAEGYMNH